MKITINKGNLVYALDKALKAVTKNVVPILEGVLLEADKNTLKITGNNLEIGVQAKCDCEVIVPGRIVVNAKLFSDIVRKLEDDIDLTLNNELLIESGNVTSKIKVLDASGYPSLPTIDEKNSEVAEIEQSAFRALINKTIFAVSPDNTREPLNGELIKIEDKTLECIAIDGFKMAVCKSQVDSGNFEAIIIGRNLNDISKILTSGKVKIYKNHNIILFETDDCIITARTIHGKFPNYKSFIKDDGCTTIEIKLKDFRNAIESLVPFIPSSDNSKIPPVVLSIKPDKLLINYSSEVGENNNIIDANICGKPLRCAFNPKHILETLRVIDDSQVKLKIIGEKQPMYIQPVNGDEYFYIMTPVIPMGER